MASDRDERDAAHVRNAALQQEKAALERSADVLREENETLRRENESLRQATGVAPRANSRALLFALLGLIVFAGMGAAVFILTARGAPSSSVAPIPTSVAPAPPPSSSAPPATPARMPQPPATHPAAGT
jgi:hypothetical protein